MLFYFFFKSHLTTSFRFFLEMWIQFQVGLCFAAKYLHFVLIQALIAAKLQLCRAIVEVDIADGIAHIFAKIACLGALKGRSSPENETIFRAKYSARRSNYLVRLWTDILVAP
jgi:hypothetical protein